MNPETLEILDQSLRYALWTFLISFPLLLIYVLVRVQGQGFRRMDRLREEFDSRLARHWGRDKVRRKDPFRPATERLRMAFHALLLAAALGLLCFVVVSFTPLPFVKNFVTTESWKVTPLRLTSLSFERFHEGFSLRGEVWNQTQEPLDDLTAMIRVWGNDRELLDEETVPVRPRPLPAGSAGTFSLSYTKHSPFLVGYDVRFADASGQEIPHVKGFDVR